MQLRKKIKILSVIKKNRCKYCKTRVNLTLDHKIPIIKGGKDDVKNLQCLCKKCNGMKSSLTDKQIRSLFRWFLEIQKSRIKNGGNPYKLK